jgi:hypothetical protein
MRIVNSVVVGMWGNLLFVVSGSARKQSRAVGENSVDVRVDAIIRPPPSDFKVPPETASEFVA